MDRCSRAREWMDKVTAAARVGRTLAKRASWESSTEDWGGRGSFVNEVLVCSIPRWHLRIVLIGGMVPLYTAIFEVRVF